MSTFNCVKSFVYCRRSFSWRDPPHPFAQHCMTPPFDSSVICRSPAMGTLHVLVANHIVQGRVIFPGAGYLEVARAAGASASRGVYFLQPLVAEPVGLLVVECAVTLSRFDIRSDDDAHSGSDGTVHCSGEHVTDTRTAIDHAVDHALVRGGVCSRAVVCGKAHTLVRTRQDEGASRRARAAGEAALSQHTTATGRAVDFVVNQARKKDRKGSAAVPMPAARQRIAAQQAAGEHDVA